MGATALADTQTLWAALLACQRLTFISQSQRHASLCGRGSGQITTQATGDKVLEIQESGTWQMDDQPTSSNRPLRFTNAYRWVFDHALQRIAISHLRQGVDSPVFLLNLIPTSDKDWATEAVHVCGQDMYELNVHIDQSNSLSLTWHIKGPKKDDVVRSVYSRTDH